MFIDLSTLTILSLAVYRLAVLITQDDGPYDLLWRMRDTIRRRYPEQRITRKDGYDYHGDHPLPGATYGTTDSWQFRGIQCVFCTSFWIGIVVALAWYLLPDLTIMLCLPLALSAVGVVVEKWAADSDD